VSLVVVCCVAASTVAADEPERELARRRFETGKLLFDQQRYAEALTEFEAAQHTLNLPAFDYNIGLCLARLDRPAEAADALERYIQSSPDDPEAAAIWQMIAQLRTTAVRKAAERAAQQQQAPPPQTPPPQAEPPKPVAAPLVPPAPPQLPLVPTVDELEARRRPYTRAAIGLGVSTGVLVAATIVTGSLALSHRSRYDTSCMTRCDDSLYDSAHRLAVATDSLIALATAAAVATVVVLVRRPREPSRPSLSAHLEPGR
jgi:tetratricopeptide (TPR) repeat protein